MRELCSGFNHAYLREERTSIICFWYTAFHLVLISVHCLTLKPTIFISGWLIFHWPQAKGHQVDRHNRNQWFLLDTWCFSPHFLTSMQTNFLLTLMSLNLMAAGICKTLCPTPPKENRFCLRNKVFNSILIKNELSAQMRTWQSANITNYLALTKWRFDRSRINCIRFRSQLNNSVWCSIWGSYSKIQKLPIQTNLSNIISHKLYFKNMKWITVWMLKASCAEMFWWYYHVLLIMTCAILHWGPLLWNYSTICWQFFADW